MAKKQALNPISAQRKINNGAAKNNKRIGIIKSSQKRNVKCK